jgi:hypothetical protein
MATATDRCALVHMGTFPGRLSYPDGAIAADGSRIDPVFDYNRHGLISYGVELPGG